MATSSAGAIYPDLENKSVLVTGGGSGIGEEIVRAFARQKAKVGFLDINEEASAKLAGELQKAGHAVHFEACDVTAVEVLRAGIERIRRAQGPIDVLVNNAAHDERHKTEEVTEDYWDGRIAVNLKHQFFAAQAVLPDMKQKGCRLDHQFRLDIMDDRARRDGGLHRIEIRGFGAHALARARLWALQHPRRETPSRPAGS